jgi:class 3 adenylate cyclase/tetratricopeptide (TPR) repeat protein
MNCSSCGADNRDGAKFCSECAAPLSAKCARCGATNRPGARFCDECGEPLTLGSARSTPESVSDARVAPEQQDATRTIEGERKTVTALFADIKGSTELMRDLDPEEARAVIDPVLQLMMEAVHRYDGYVVQSAGDGIFALFGAPVAHEDHPQRALHAAIAIQQELQAEHRLKPVPLEVRIGIHTGEVVLRLLHTGGHTEYTPIGHTANLASRLQAVAPAGSIAVSEDTRKLVEGYFELNPLAPAELKGISESVNAYEVTGLGPLRTHFQLSARRGLTKFVGREREIVEMKRALEQARSGHGQIVAVVAEAGTGKSRLFYEFKKSLPVECKLLEAYSVSYGKASAWLPVLELLRGFLGIQESADPTIRREKVRALLAALDPALSDTQSYLFGLLAIPEDPDPLAQMDPQIKRRRTMEALKRIMLSESIKQPVVIIFEDLHWIDGETQALLDVLADSIANARVLMLVNYRPEYRHEWTNKTYYTQLRLDALGRERAAEMLSELLGDGVELVPLKRLITERTEGNPFFIEEMVQALFDEGAIIRNGSVKVARSLSQLRLPPTVQGILAARIDRLGAEQKDLLQTLAVIGHESPLPVVRQVASRSDTELERILGDLQAAEFIYEQPALTEVEYVFKHALTQEVAYGSLLIERRKLLHEQAGAAMEILYADRLDDHLSELAHHYERSGNTQKAIQYLQRAGQQAIQRSAHNEAIKLLSAASRLIETLPETPERIHQELSVQLGLGVSFMVTRQWSAPEVAQAYSRARELCRLLGNPPELLPVLFGLYGFHALRAELNTALELSSQLLAIAQRQQDPAVLVNSHFAVGLVLFFQGEFVPARTHLELVSSFYSPALHQSAVAYGGHDPAVHSLAYQIFVLWQLGYPDQAADRIQAALNLAQELSDPYSSALAFFGAAIGHLMRREGMSAWQFADADYRLCVEHALGPAPIALGLRGQALVQLNKTEEGAFELRESLSAMRSQGLELATTHNLMAQAEAYGKLGRADEGLGAIAEAMQVASKTGLRYFHGELHRLQGELLLMRGAKNAESNIEEQAEVCFRQAIEVARHQSAKSFELRATTSLARLLESQGRRDEARAMLAEIYNWFTEGFDTRDLKDARALLEELLP